MSASKKPKSFQEIHRQRQKSSFIGREQQVALFHQNLEFGDEDERYRFVFNVWGQGGVGKTTLLGQFRSISERLDALTAYVDEGERDVPGVMGRLAEDFEKQGCKLTQFSERYRVYRQKREELEADPDAPQGFSAFLGRTIAKSAVKLGKQIPVAGVALEFVDEETVTNQGGEWAAFLAKKLTNKDEVHLLREPLEVLTPLFLKDWCKIAEEKAVTFLFDTYERTGEFLDEWLRDVLKGTYGTVPSNCLWVIAGREELDRNRWAGYEDVMVRLPLEPFSEEEARQYLTRKQVVDENTITVILNLSGRLPLLIATLAETSPNNPKEVGDPSGTAVERFLKWETDPKRRQIALDAALPRCLNRDLIAQLRPHDATDDLFEWLKQKPFVRERTDGWAYHDVVRTQMLRYKRLESPQGWADLHSKLAESYDNLRNNLQLESEKAQRDATWQNHTLNVLYHRLCQSPQKHLSIALNEFLAALKNQRKFAEQWAEVMVQAGKDANRLEIQRWGEQLVEGLKAYNEDRYEVTLAMFSSLVEHLEIDPKWQMISRAWRGKTYKLMKRYEEALQDFNQAIELDPKYDWAIANRGETYRAMKRYEEALQDFNQAIELNPKYDWAIASRGQTYGAMKRYEEALQDFNQAIELDPKYNWAIASRGQTYRAMKRYEEALQDFNQAIELNPKYDWAIANRGQTYRKMKRYEEALQDFNQAIELDSKYIWAITSRGQTYLEMKRYEEALQDFNRATELDPGSISAILCRALTFRAMEHYENALEDFNLALTLEPENVEILILRRPLLVRLKAFEELTTTCSLLANHSSEVLEVIRQELQIEPEKLWQELQQAASIMQLGSNGAQLLFDKNLELLKRSPETITSTLQADALLYEALMYIRDKQFEKALIAINRAIVLNSSSNLFQIKGKILQLTENHEEALEAFNKANELDPGNVSVFLSRGSTYQSMERYEESLQDFNHVLELDPENEKALLLRMPLLIRTQAFEELTETYSKVFNKTDGLMNMFQDLQKMEPEKLQKGMQQVALMMQLGSNEVKTLFNKILELSEVLQQNPELFTSILQAEGLLFEALTYERNQQFDKALSTINRAIEFNPKSDLAFARRGEIYRLMERYDKALQDFNQAIELNTKYAWAIRKRGQIFLLIRNYQRALVDLNLAVELDSENDWNLYVRALIHRVLEQDEPAKTDVAQAICMAQADYEKSPDNHRNIFNLALYCLAARKDESAKHFYRDALHRNAPAARIQEAMKDLEDFLTIFPYHSLARKAHQVLQKALQKD